ncbi:MAG: hypothetical protein ACFB6S_01030 [Geminicoccaceae bacterium]
MRRAPFAALLTLHLVLAPLAAAQAGSERQWLVIRTYEMTGSNVSETIAVPLSLVARASRLVPQSIRRELELEGIPLDELVRLVVEEDLRGPVAEITDEQNGERMVVAIEER